LAYSLRSNYSVEKYMFLSKAATQPGNRRYL